MLVGLRWLTLLLVWLAGLGWLPGAPVRLLLGVRTGEVLIFSDVARTFGLLWLRQGRGGELELGLRLGLGLGLGYELAFVLLRGLLVV